MRTAIAGRRAWPYVVLAAAVCVFFWPVLFGGDVLAPGYMQQRVEPWASEGKGPILDDPREWDSLLWDDIAQFVPWRVYAARVLRTGEIPLWDPHEFCGTPFVANGQSAVFYPPNFVLWLLRIGPLYCLGLSAALHYLFAGVCTFVLLRRLGGGNAASLLAAFGFMFGGFVVTWTLLPPLMNTAAWLPFCIVSAHRIFAAPRWSAGGWLAFGLGMAFLAGHPQVFSYVALATVCYCAVRLIGVLAAPATREQLGQPLRKAAAFAWALTLLGLVLWLAAGSADLFAACLVGWAGYLVLRSRTVQVGHRLRSRALALVGVLGLAAVLSLLLPAAQGLPTMELAIRGHRGIGKPTEAGWAHPYAGQPARALRLDELTTLLNPNAHGTPVDNTYKPRRVTDVFAEKCGFVGTAVLLLALAAPVLKPSRHTFFFAGLSATALLIAMATPVGRAYYFHVPGASVGGSLTRVMCVFTFSTAVLGGLGLDGLLARLRGHSEGPLRGALAAAVGAAVVIGTGIQLLAFGIFFNATTPRGQLYQRTEMIRALMVRADTSRVLGLTHKLDWRMTSVRGATFPPNSAMVYGLDSVNGYDSLSIGRYRTYGRLIESVRAEAEALTVLATHGATAAPAADDEASGERVLRIHAERPGAEVELELAQPLEGPYGPLWAHFVRTASSGTFLVGPADDGRPARLAAYSPVREPAEEEIATPLRWYERVPLRLKIDWPGSDEAAGTDLDLDFLVLASQPSPTANGNMVLLENVGSPLLRSAGLRYVLTQELIGAPGRTEVATGVNTHLYELASPVARVSMCTRVRFVPDEAAALAALLRPDWTPERETIIVAPPGSRPPTPRLTESVEAHYPMPVLAYGPNTMVAEPGMQRSIGTYVVAADAIYPGWHAFVDGKEQPLFAANYIFRAAYLPSGQRRVAFVYLPASFKIGAFISLLVAALLVGVVVTRRELLS